MWKQILDFWPSLFNSRLAFGLLIVLGLGWVSTSSIGACNAQTTIADYHSDFDTFNVPVGWTYERQWISSDAVAGLDWYTGDGGYYRYSTSDLTRLYSDGRLFVGSTSYRGRIGYVVSGGSTNSVTLQLAFTRLTGLPFRVQVNGVTVHSGTDASYNGGVVLGILSPDDHVTVDWDGSNNSAADPTSGQSEQWVNISTFKLVESAGGGQGGGDQVWWRFRPDGSLLDTGIDLTNKSFSWEADIIVLDAGTNGYYELFGALQTSSPVGRLTGGRSQELCVGGFASGSNAIRGGSVTYNIPASEVVRVRFSFDTTTKLAEVENVTSGESYSANLPAATTSSFGVLALGGRAGGSSFDGAIGPVSLTVDGVQQTITPDEINDNWTGTPEGYVTPNGLLTGGTDTDGDGYNDNEDAFPNDPSEWADSDGDGYGDNGDAFPNDPAEWNDSDGDGVGDNGDAFPNDPSEWSDSDGDGVGDNSDPDPNDPNVPNGTGGGDLSWWQQLLQWAIETFFDLFAPFLDWLFSTILGYLGAFVAGLTWFMRSGTGVFFDYLHQDSFDQIFDVARALNAYIPLYAILGMSATYWMCYFAVMFLRHAIKFIPTIG